MGMESKQSNKTESNIGKANVTPVQVAFIVDRYLADNNCAAALAAFRSEASDLLSQTKGKEVPNGLMGLGEILDEYITLKEQRVMVEQEKRRIEIALGGIGDVMRTYYSPNGVPPPLSPALLTPNLIAASPSSSSYSFPSPAGHTSQGTAISGVFSFPPKRRELANMVTPLPSSFSYKRKTSRTTNQIPPSSKKFRTNTTKEASVIGTSIPPIMEESSTAITRINQRTVNRPVRESSVAKNLFMQPSYTQVNSSPKTPPHALLNQGEISGSPVDNSSHLADVTANCSILSSQTIIVSPHKGKGYVAIQRSFHVTSSPLKSDTNKPSKRDHVKGRLDFDSDAPSSSKAHNASDNSPTSTDGEEDGCFDFDLPDLDIFNGEFPFPELFVDLDLDSEGVASQPNSADSSPRSKNTVNRQSFAANQALDSSSQPMVAELQSEETQKQGTDSTAMSKRLTNV